MPYFFCFPLFPRQDTGYWLLIKVAIKYAFILPALEWLIVGQLRRLLQGGPGWEWLWLCGMRYRPVVKQIKHGITKDPSPFVGQAALLWP